MRTLFLRLFPFLALRQAKDEILSLRSENLILQENLQGLTSQLRQAQAQLQSLESSQTREVDSLRHMVDWFAVQSPQRQQMFGTLPANSLPPRDLSPMDLSPDRMSARRLAHMETMAFMEEARKLQEAMERGGEHYSSSRGGEVT